MTMTPHLDFSLKLDYDWQKKSNVTKSSPYTVEAMIWG